MGDIVGLITRAPWREAVTYRDSWPHEYVVVKKDGQEALLAAFCARIAAGEGVECLKKFQEAFDPRVTAILSEEAPVSISPIPAGAL